MVTQQWPDEPAAPNSQVHPESALPSRPVHAVDSSSVETRRKDDARPAAALQWGERPDRWTLLLTGPTGGLVGEFGKAWDGHPDHLERVNVFAQGAPMKLEDSEQYRMQMAGIGTAALGYWTEADTVHPDYDTPALRDVAKLYAKYADLHRSDAQLSGIVDRLGERMAMMAKYLTTDARAKFEEEWSEFAARQRAERIEAGAAGAPVNLYQEFQPLPAPFPERDPSKTDEQQGLYNKFDVRRTDGSSAPGGKHYGCRYFVIDLDHDAHAIAAMGAYAEACAITHPQLASDIRAGLFQRVNRAAAALVAFAPPPGVRDAIECIGSPTAKHVFVGASCSYCGAPKPEGGAA